MLFADLDNIVHHVLVVLISISQNYLNTTRRGFSNDLVMLVDWKFIINYFQMSATFKIEA